MSNYIKSEKAFFLSSGSLTTAGNLTFTSPNQFSVSFPNPINIEQNSEVAVSQLQYTQSVRNITAALSNNTFSYIINGVTRSLTIPDGFYSYADFGGWLTSQQINNLDYVLDSGGNKVTFITAVLNAPIYAVTFTLDVIAVPSGGSNPNALTTGSTCQIIVPSTNIRTYLGMSAGTYPASPAVVQTFVNSNSIPSVSSVTTALLNMVGVDQSLISSNPQTLFSFSTTNSIYGGQIEPTIYSPIFCRLNPGIYSNFTFYLTDQSGIALNIIDSTQFFILLVIRKSP